MRGVYATAGNRPIRRHAPRAATQPEIVAAFKQAQERKLYDLVEHRNSPKREAYANTNHVEYFAEVSCMFLDKIDYPADALQVARNFDRSLFVKSGRYQRDYKERFDRQQQELQKQQKGIKREITMCIMFFVVCFCSLRLSRLCVLLTGGSV